LREICFFLRNVLGYSAAFASTAMPDPNADRPAIRFRSPNPPSDEFRQRMRMVQDRLASSADASQATARWAPTLIGVALCIFAFFTLFPFNFTLHTGQAFDWHPVDLGDPSDWIMNVILALPLGFALTALGTGRGWRKKSAWKSFLLAAGVTCVCSTAVECLQLFLPSRVSALADILSNTTGGIVGCFCFLPLGIDVVRVIDRLARAMRRRVVGLRAAGTLMVVVAVVCGSLVWMLRRPRLATWNPDFPLLLGNENHLKPADARPWDGTVTGLHIANRAATAAEAENILAHGDFAAIMGNNVIADYALLGPGPYADASHHLPDLSWATGRPPIAAGAPVHFANGNFLSTVVRAKPLVHAITDTDSFTIAFVAAADRPDQTGPARIVTSSRNPLVRNFTLGQEKADLIIRLRTRSGGNNGTCPEWLVPGTFRDHDSHAFLITYDGDILRVYVDTLSRTWRVRTPPEYSILRPILARDFLTMSMTGLGNRRLVALFYALCLMPIALLLGIILANAISPTSRLHLWPLGVRMVPPAVGLLFGVAAMYVTVDRLGVRAMGWTEFPLAGAILAIETAIFGHWWARGPARSRAASSMAQITFLGDAADLPGK
jgi:VanZ family protein